MCPRVFPTGPAVPVARAGGVNKRNKQKGDEHGRGPSALAVGGGGRHTGFILAVYRAVSADAHGLAAQADRSV